MRDEIKGRYIVLGIAVNPDGFIACVPVNPGDQAGTPEDAINEAKEIANDDTGVFPFAGIVTVFIRAAEAPKGPKCP
jgi:hypothetical protein